MRLEDFTTILVRKPTTLVVGVRQFVRCSIEIDPEIYNEIQTCDNICTKTIENAKKELYYSLLHIFKEKIW